MARASAVLFLLLAAVAASPQPSSVQTDARPAERYAFIVVTEGNEGAIALRGVLQQKYDYRPDNVVILSGPEATRTNIQRQFLRLVERAMPRDSVLIHLEAPASGEGIDTTYLAADSDTRERWTQFTILDVAKILYAIRADTVLLVMPLCESPKSGSGETLAPLVGRLANLAVITFCQRDVDATSDAVMAAAMAKVLAAGPDLDEPLAAEQLSELLQKSVPVHLRLWLPPGSSEGQFTFTPSRDRLDSYAKTLISDADVKLKEEALGQLIESLLAVPADRREKFLTTHPEIERLAGDTAVAVPLRSKAVWAIGEMQHPRAAEILDRVYTQSESDPALRRIAVEAAVKLAPPAGIELLRKALSDSEDGIRLVAIRAAAQRRDEESKEKLKEISADANPDVKVAALQGLALFTDEDGSLKSVVQACLADPAASVRREAITTWIALGGTPFTEAMLGLLATDRDPTVRQTIAYALGRTPRPEDDELEKVVSALRSAVRPENPTIVREAAIWSLGELGTAAERGLMGILQNRDDDPRMIAAAAQALGKQKNRGAVKRLIELVNTSQHVEVTTASALALGTIGDSSARVIGALFEARLKGETYLRAAAERSLDKLSPRREDLLPLLKDKSAFVRGEAAAKIGAFKDPVDLKDLSKLLDDPEPAVRDSVLNLLTQYTDATSRAQVREFLTDDDGYRREAAAQLIGTWQWKESSSALAEGVKDKDPRVRVQVVKSLGRLADPNTAPAIMTAAQDPDPRVRLAAAAALTVFSTNDVVRTLRKLSEDSDPEVRQAAIDALRKRPEQTRK